MKIKKFKVKARVFRNSSQPNDIGLELLDNEPKEFVGEETLDGENINNLPSISHRLSQENDKQKAIACTDGMIPAGKNEAEVFIELKYLSK